MSAPTKSGSTPGLKVKVLEFGEPGGFQVLPAPKGTCAECAVDHDPTLPHNAQSLSYQYRFFAANKRWPDWRDAMAHCSNETKKQWRAALIEHGVDVDGGKVNPASPAQKGAAR